MSMREVFAHTLRSSLDWDDSQHEKAVDKLTAFCYADRLATLLWRLKYGNDKTAYKPIVMLLAKSLKPMNRNISIKIAEQALYEWLFPFCPACLGAKEVMAGELRVVCRACNGVGVARYSDREREMKVGGNFSKQIENIHRIITGMDIQPGREMRKRLER